MGIYDGEGEISNTIPFKAAPPGKYAGIVVLRLPRTAKEEVRKMLEKMPDAATFEDIQYHIFYREKIECELNDI